MAAISRKHRALKKEQQFERNYESLEVACRGVFERCADRVTRCGGCVVVVCRVDRGSEPWLAA